MEFIALVSLYRQRLMCEARQERLAARDRAQGRPPRNRGLFRTRPRFAVPTLRLSRPALGNLVRQ